jgi:hypothetical protein
MAAIYAVVRIDEPGVPRETLERMVENMKLAGAVDLDSPVATPPATILGVVKDTHEPLMPFFTGEVE